MTRTKNKGPQFDARNLIKAMGVEETMKQIIDVFGLVEVFAALKRKKILNKLSAKQRQELRELLE